MSETSKKFEIHKNIVDLDKYPLKWQIEQLTYAIKNFDKFERDNYSGLCDFFNLIFFHKKGICYYDYKTMFTLFNNQNALHFGGTDSIWWKECISKPRIKFLEWMLTETKKLDHGTK